MSNRIHILPDDIANRIAAGEVVERPASVVKELVENAIDSGADRIDIEASAGGKESLRVSDNGCGMSRDDALLALERHATSKIQGLDDLRALRTHGFRGEALPSIAAVSRMTVETRRADDVEGTRIDIVGGRVRDVTTAGRSSGTTLTIHGLFFNVPARRKFLKGVETEFRHIVNAVTAVGLAYPAIAFRLRHNGRETLRFDRADRERRMAHIFGVQLGEDAVLVEGREDAVDVWGFVGSPEKARKSGAQQMLIVNRRWVIHKAIVHAVYEGFGGLLPRGFTPSFCLFLDVDPGRLDINVHPSKREVRFADERSVYQAVATSVGQALRQADVIPEPGGAPSMPAVTPGVTAVAQEVDRRGVAEPASHPYRPGPMGIDVEPQMALPLTVRKTEGRGSPSKGDPIDRREFEGESHAEISVWQLHNRFILAHIKNGMIIVDQQVAHQRVLYEQALNHFQAQPATSQRLLFPLTLDFGIKEIHVVREAMPLLERMGFGIRDFGGNTVVVDAIPVGLKAWQDGQLLRDILRDIMEVENRTSASPGQQNRQVSDPEHRLAASFAWHTSIRKGEALGTKEMRGLIDQLFATREPFVCPYGKPTLVKISLDEIAGRFGR